MLALLSLRVWDEGTGDSALERITELLNHLQGASGSGQQFVENAETLLLVGTSHFEPDIKAYERLLEKVRLLHPSHQRKFAIVHSAMLNGLLPDARAFLGKAPASLARCEGERSRFCSLFQRYKDDLLKEFESHRPSERHYSPISFTFNFPHNVVKAVVVDAIIRGKVWDLKTTEFSAVLRQPIEPLP